MRTKGGDAVDEFSGQSDQQWNKWLWFICFCLQRLFSRLFSHKDVTQRSWWQLESQCWCSSGKNKAASRKGKQAAGRHSKRWELDNAPPVWGQISSGKIAKLFSNERLFFWFVSSRSWNLVEVLTVVTGGNVSERKEKQRLSVSALTQSTHLASDRNTISWMQMNISEILLSSVMR